MTLERVLVDPSFLIKFSFSDYNKFRGERPPFRVRLLDVWKVFSDYLSREFVDYDTVTESGRRYPLEKNTLYLVLLLQKESGEIFTTLRRFEQDKFSYYRKNIGNFGEVILGCKSLCLFVDKKVG